MHEVFRRGVADLWNVLPERPDLMSRVDLPVYMIHMAPGPDDYYFVFDFEELVARSREGGFVRPRIRLYAGRDDFDRQVFAGYFRQSFTREFDAMRKAQASQQQGGWFDRAQEGVWQAGSAWGAMSLIVLWLALSAGKAVMPRFRLPRLLHRRSKEAQLESEIETLKGQVDAGLAAMQVTLHPELQLHAMARGAPGDPEALDLSGWPLPGFVTQALKDAQNKRTDDV